MSSSIFRRGVVATIVLLGLIASPMAAGAAQLPSGDSITAIRQEAEYSTADAEVLRLYRAFFLREPDAVGARYWLDLRRDGMSLEEIASYFVISEEFTNTYGSLSDEDFVKQVYENVIGRQADGRGLAYWTTELTDGRLTRGGVVYWITANEELIRSYPYGALGPDLTADDLAGAALPVGVCDSVTEAHRTLLAGESVWTGEDGEEFRLHDDDGGRPWSIGDYDGDGTEDIAFTVACFDSADRTTSSGFGLWLSGQDPLLLELERPGSRFSGHRGITITSFPVEIAVGVTEVSDGGGPAQPGRIRVQIIGGEISYIHERIA